MQTYPFMQVNAFNERPLGGNPCAVFFDADDLDDETMLALAREMNLSESAFVRQSEIADFGARDRPRWKLSVPGTTYKQLKLEDRLLPCSAASSGSNGSTFT